MLCNKPNVLWGTSVTFLMHMQAAKFRFQGNKKKTLSGHLPAVSQHSHIRKAFLRMFF